MSFRDTAEPWRRQSREPSKGYAEFIRYLELGPARSLRVLAESGECAVKIGQLENYSRKWKWVNRAATYDDHTLNAAMERRAQVREAVRQPLFAEAFGARDRLLALARGEMPEDHHVIEVFDKHQKVIGSKPAVPATVVMAANVRILELCGLVIPKRVETVGVNEQEAKRRARASAQAWSSEDLVALAKFLQPAEGDGGE